MTWFLAIILLIAVAELPTTMTAKGGDTVGGRHLMWLLLGGRVVVALALTAAIVALEVL